MLIIGLYPETVARESLAFRETLAILPAAHVRLRAKHTPNLTTNYLFSQPDFVSMDVFTVYNGLFLRIGLYLLIFWPTVGYHVYQDAKKRGRSSPRLRGVVYGFLGLLGLVIYIATKKRGDAANQ